MPLTEEEREFIYSKLNRRERKQIAKFVDEVTAMQLLTDKDKGDLYRKWMHDSERYMGFTFVHTKQLVKHSITLAWLTGALIFLTVTLAALAGWEIYLRLT